MYVNYKSTHV